MQVVILAGGKGTRAYPFTEYLPKPMMPVGGKPMLVQIMQLFAAQGHKEFIVSVGHRKEVIVDYFANKTFDWDIKIVDTGAETDTAGRIYNCRHLLRDQFIATYGDGICDVSLPKLIDYHNSHDGLVTLTSVPLQSQYGTVEFDQNGLISGFKEKPRLKTHWINAGFFIMNREVFNFWNGSNLENEVYPKLVEMNKLYTYNHDGFFKSMDTYKDQQELEAMLSEGSIGNLPKYQPTNVDVQFFDHKDLIEVDAS